MSLSRERYCFLRDQSTDMLVHHSWFTEYCLVQFLSYMNSAHCLFSSYNCGSMWEDQKFPEFNRIKIIMLPIRKRWRLQV
jgi:hypothetical protein